MNQNVIDIESLSKSFDGNRVLKNVSASVAAGEVIAILGENGAGKSTLLETLLGFSYPSSGQVTLFGEGRPVELSNYLKLKIGYVPQVDELLPNMRVAQYLEMIAGFYPNWNRARIEQLSEQWGLNSSKRISSLSVGQRQMVSILSAIGHEPDLLVLDEPMASLDPASRRRFLQVLIETQIDQGTTILFSTHIVSDVERIASRVWMVQDGELKIDESLDAIKERTKHSLEDLFLQESA